jgi:hypothetical protein
MLCHVALVRTNVLEQHIASIIRPILVALMMEVIHSSKMSVLTRAIQLNIPEDGISS